MSEAFGLPFVKAEELKINHALGKLKLDTADPAVDVLKTVGNNYYNKIGQEISRSLVTYKRLKKGKYPEIIILTGLAAKDPKITEFLANSQEVPVILFDPDVFFNNESLEILNEQDELRYTLSEILGFVYLYSEGKISKQVINLLPPARVKALEFKKRKIWLLISALFIAISPLPSFYTKIQAVKEEYSQQEKLKIDLKQKQNDISKIESKKDEIQFYQSINLTGFKYINDFRKESQRLNSQTRLINEIQNVTIAGNIENIWIDSINFSDQLNTSNYANDLPYNNKGLTIEIQGRYLVSSTDEISESTDSTDLRERLIDLNSAIQQNLTERLGNIPMFTRLTKKVFSTDGKGDLFKRFYTHFEIHAEVDLTK